MKWLQRPAGAAAVALCSLVSGCAAPAVIGDIAEDKVVVYGNQYTSQDEITAEAERGCGLYGRQAVPISKRFSGNPYSPDLLYLFACKAAAPPIANAAGVAAVERAPAADDSSSVPDEPF